MSNDKMIKNNNQIKENNNIIKTEDLILLSQNNEFLNRKTRWERNNDDAILKKFNIKKSHWGFESTKTFTPLMVSEIPKGLDLNEFEILLRKQRLEDLNLRLEKCDFEEEDPDLREESPEPIYDNNGKRINTRIMMYKEKYINEKNNIIFELMKYDKNYQPPHDYKPPKKLKKIYIQNNDKYNFTKYLIGYKGETQKRLEKITNCKIHIRGKGSNWSNSTYTSNYVYLSQNEPLHILLIANNDEDIEKAIKIISPYLDENSPEYNKAKNTESLIVKNMNNKEPACEYCGEKGHCTFECPNNIGEFNKVEIKCEYCGDKGHVSMDCPFKPQDNIGYYTNKKVSDLNSIYNEIQKYKNMKDVPKSEVDSKVSNIRNSILMKGNLNLPMIPINNHIMKSINPNFNATTYLNNSINNNNIDIPSFLNLYGDDNNNDMEIYNDFLNKKNEEKINLNDNPNENKK
jgi:splicing factor 1